MYRCHRSQATMAKYKAISSAYRKAIYVHRCKRENVWLTRVTLALSLDMLTLTQG